MSKKLRFAIVALTTGLVLVPTFAFSETRQVTVPRGKSWNLVSIGIYDRILCGVYPVHNVHIDPQPAHGTAEVVEHVTSLGKDTGLCAGKSFKAQFVVYKPAGNYAGPDRLTVHWTQPRNVQSINEVPEALDIDITVK